MDKQDSYKTKILIQALREAADNLRSTSIDITYDNLTIYERNLLSSFYTDKEIIYNLEIENGRLQALLNDAKGIIVGDTCKLCNFLERGDCHAEKQRLADVLREAADSLDEANFDLEMWMNDDSVKSGEKLFTNKYKNRAAEIRELIKEYEI